MRSNNSAESMIKPFKEAIGPQFIGPALAINSQVSSNRAVEKRQVVDFIWPCSFPITQYVYRNNCLTKLTSRKDARLQGIIPKSQNHIGRSPKIFATLGGSNMIGPGKF